MVKDSADSTLFSIFILDPFSGLKYLCGPTHAKPEIVNRIKKDVILNTNARNYKIILSMAGMMQHDSIKGSKYSVKDQEFFTEDSLHSLAKESGGKYLEGETATITDQIGNLHRAYYEIAFPESSQYKGSVRKIKLTSNRKGVDIQTLHSLEKGRSYPEMNEIEKEIFALNLVNRNPFFLEQIAHEDVVVKKYHQKNKKDYYKIGIPENWIQKEIDLYKTWLGQSGEDSKIEKTRLIPQIMELEIVLDTQENHIGCFALINPQSGIALIQGIRVKKSQIPDFEKIPEIQAMGKEFKTNADIEPILRGAGGYCEKLKQAGFHYICKEKVKETMGFFGQNFTDDIGAYENRASESDMLKRSEPQMRIKRGNVGTYLFDYQIVKDRSGIKEQRKLISRKKKREGENAGLQLSAFLSEKAVFSPVTLLAIERQPLYE